MQILEIRAPRGKSKKYHVSLYLDSTHEEVRIPLYAAEVKRLGLAEGTQRADSLYEEIETGILRPRIRIRCEYLLNARAYTEKELREKLSSDGYPVRLIDAAVEEMKLYRYVDDAGYAERYIELKRSRSSAAALRRKLISKGIEEHVIDGLLSAGEHTDREVLRGIASKKYRDADLTDRKKMAGAYRYLASKGFSFDDISAILEEIKVTESES